jgi:hypothetical protein
MVQNPPLRKLGVFDLDQFFPPKDRLGFAMRLNGLLASPTFGAWLAGTPLDIDSMLHTHDGRPRCAIVTTAHLGDQERQFVTTLILGKLVTWMRKQSGTTDLRALLYMDEVAGYLPPTAAPPTKKPIMTLMKQARAFGVGVVLSTQNPVDIDYKAISNAGTWMIGRLQTDRDKQRLLDGMSAASGGVDVKAIGDTISGLAKREFVLRRAGKDQPEVFTTRWAMSYLRGPLTRDQIATLMAPQKQLPPPVAATAAPPPPPLLGTAPIAASNPAPTPVAATASTLSANAVAVQPAVADGIPVRWVDVAAPWLATVGADSRGTEWEASIVARVALRYDDEKADFVHDDEYETVLFPLTEQVDASRGIAVDYDDRDLRDLPPTPVTYRLCQAPLNAKTFFARVQRDLINALVRDRTVEILTNGDLKLFGRPGETAEAFALRCQQVAGNKSDEETAKLRDKYETKVTSAQQQIRTAEGRAEVLESEAKGRRNQEILGTAGSILGSLLGGKRSTTSMIGSVLGKAGTAAGRRTRTEASGKRLDAAETKLQSLHELLDDLERQVSDDVMAINQKWTALAGKVTTMSVPLERTDVRVTQLALVWLPVP